MKGKNFVGLFLAIVIIFGACYVGLCGITMAGYSYAGVLDADKGFKKGLDLAGGSTLVFEAQAESVTNEQMDSAREVMRKRLDSLGYLEATVVKTGEKRLTVEIPELTNPQEAVETLGKTAQLSFTDADGNVVLDGSQVKKAYYSYQPVDQNGPSQHTIVLEFTEEGRVKFADATQLAVSKKAEQDEMGRSKNYISIKLDEEIISSPSVDERIDNESCIIYGGYESASDAKADANLIASGQLPFSLGCIESSSVGPTLGEKALSTSMLAALIGLILIFIYMIAFYRVLGLAADIALVAYVAIITLVMGIGRINLSLPGIAGIILTIGMAVDANVVIFERVKEELRLGKTIKAAFAAGYKRALVAVIDSNVTTLIVAVVLFYFGSGTIKGFGITLGLGIIASMISAIFITKFIAHRFIGIGIRKPELYAYGVNVNKNKEVEK